MNQKFVKKLLFALLLTAVAALVNAGATAFAASRGAIHCNIQFGSCTARTLDGITVEFDVRPKPVRAMSELSFIVRLSKDGAPVTNASVEVELTMPGLFMGTTRPTLDEADKGRYEGKSRLMSSASGRKTWQADVIIMQGVQRNTAGFTFELD